jgi:hypothetical protein
MTAPNPASAPTPEDDRGATDRRAVHHAHAARKLIADGKVTPDTAAVVHALLALEARLEEQTWYVADVAEHTAFIG